MPKIYEIPMYLYVECIDERRAAGMAELSAFTATRLLRVHNSAMVTDLVTSLVSAGKPVEVPCAPADIYKREVLVEAFGEDTSIRLLNHISDY